MDRTLTISMFGVAAALAAVASSALVGCDPDEDRCDPSLCHPPQHVVGEEPNCECVGPDDEPGETETWAVSASVDLTLPTGWSLGDVQLSPQSVGLSTQTPQVGPVGVRIAGADFETTGPGQWSLTGGVVAQPWVIHGADPVAVVRWNGPIVIVGTKANGDAFEHTFNVPSSAVALTSSVIASGVEFTHSTAVGPATITVEGTIIQSN